MRQSWFRVHTSILDSRKFEGLSLAAQGLWVRLGALAKDRDDGGRLSRRDGSPMDVERIAREVGFPCSEVEPLMDELSRVGLIEKDEEGYWRLHDWDEWQTRAEEREEWRERQRRHRNGAKAGGDAENGQAGSELDVTPCHAPSRDVTGCHPKIENKIESESENNNIARSARSAPPRGADVDLTDPDIAFILAKYQQHGLAPPEGEALRQEKSALLAIEQKHAVTRTKVSEAADWMFVTYAGKRGFGVLYRQWGKIVQQMAQQQARAAPLPRKEEPKPSYFRLVSVPPDWGGLQ